MAPEHRDDENKAQEKAEDPENPLEPEMNKTQQIIRLRRLIQILEEDEEDSVSFKYRRPPQKAPQAASTPKPDNMAELTNNLAMAVKQLTWSNAVLQKPVNHFGARDYEDPEEFCKQMDQHFAKKEITEDQQKLRIITEQLREGAARWYEQYKVAIRTYEQFKERLINKYKNTAITAAGRARLYGEKQTNSEPADIFIIRKDNLFRRFDPGLSDAVKAEVILEQLRPEIRACLRGHAFLDVEQLIKVASQVEIDQQKSSRANIRPNMEQRRPLNNERNEVRGNTRHRENEERRPTNDNLRPCRFCGERHLMRFCPRNPYNQPGNARAGGAVNRIDDALPEEDLEL